MVFLKNVGQDRQSCSSLIPNMQDVTVLLLYGIIKDEVVLSYCKLMYSCYYIFTKKYFKMISCSLLNSVPKIEKHKFKKTQNGKLLSLIQTLTFAESRGS